MKLHGAVYLIVGLVTTIMSSFIPNFGVFIVVGVVFMAIGIGKFIMGARPSNKNPNVRHTSARQTQQVHQMNTQSRPYTQQQQNYDPRQRQQVQMSREEYEQYQHFLAYKRMQQGRQQ